MKKLMLFACLTIMLAGCSVISKLTPSKFDNVEFGKLVELSVISGSPLVGAEWCRKGDLNRMAYLSAQLKVYSANRLNGNISIIYSDIDKMVVELQQRENPSTIYCQMKRENIHEITSTALKVFGGRKG